MLSVVGFSPVIDQGDSTPSFSEVVSFNSQAFADAKAKTEVEAGKEAKEEVKAEAPVEDPVKASKEVGPALDVDVDVMKQFVGPLMEIVKNWKVLGLYGVMIAILNILIALLASPWAKGWFGSQSRMIRRAAIIILGQVEALLILVSSGVGWGEAIIAGLFVSGGAVAVYEFAVKPFMTKKA